MVLEEKPALAEEEESDDEAIDMEVNLQIKIWAIIGLAWLVNKFFRILLRVANLKKTQGWWSLLWRWVKSLIRFVQQKLFEIFIRLLNEERFFLPEPMISTLPMTNTIRCLFFQITIIIIFWALTFLILVQTSKFPHFQTPRLWLFGYDEKRQAMTVDQVKTQWRWQWCGWTYERMKWSMDVMPCGLSFSIKETQRQNIFWKTQLDAPISDVWGLQRWPRQQDDHHGDPPTPPRTPSGLLKLDFKRFHPKLFASAS